MNNAIVLVLTVGLMWSGAPFLARVTGLNASVMAALIGTGTMVPLIPLFFNQDFTGPGGKAIALGLFAGFLNGIGLLAWYRLVGGSNEGMWDLSSVLPAATILLCVVLVVGGRVFFDEPLSTQRIAGIMTAGIAIYLLR